MVGPQYPLGGFRLNSHIYSLEIAHQLNASFPQVKSEKKKTMPIRTIPSQSGHLDKDAMAASKLSGEEEEILPRGNWEGFISRASG